MSSVTDIKLIGGCEFAGTTQPELFVCTLTAILNGPSSSVKELTDKFENRCTGSLKAVDSNFGHHSQPGFSHLIKQSKKNNKSDRKKENKPRVIKKPRQTQGDGTCFQSMTEFNFNLGGDKEYKVKLFPTTLHVQIPGVILSDLSDGYLVIQELVNCLNNLPSTNDEKFEIGIVKPNMLNYKFRIRLPNTRVIINLNSLSKYLMNLERLKIVIGDDVTNIEGWDHIVLCQYVIHSTKPPVGVTRVSFRIKAPNNRNPMVNIFQSGKVNILGGDSEDSRDIIYGFVSELFKKKLE